MAIYRLSAAAEADIIGKLAYTDYHFGETARLRYETLLSCGLRDIGADPARIGSVARDELGTNVRSYHLRYSRQRARTPDGWVRAPRHLLIYRVEKPDVVGIGRVLHDSMEMRRHLPDSYRDERLSGLTASDQFRLGF